MTYAVPQKDRLHIIKLANILKGSVPEVFSEHAVTPVLLSLLHAANRDNSVVPHQP